MVSTSSPVYLSLESLCVFTSVGTEGSQYLPAQLGVDSSALVTQTLPPTSVIVHLRNHTHTHTHTQTHTHTHTHTQVASGTALPGQHTRLRHGRSLQKLSSVKGETEGVI